MKIKFENLELEINPFELAPGESFEFEESNFNFRITNTMQIKEQEKKQDKPAKYKRIRLEDYRNKQESTVIIGARKLYTDLGIIRIVFRGICDLGQRMKWKDLENNEISSALIHNRFGSLTNVEDLIITELKKDEPDTEIKNIALKYCMQHGLDNITDVWPHIVGVDVK